MVNKPQYFGVIDEDPFHYQTWSGTSRYFFGAFAERGELAGATGTELGALQAAYLKAKNIHADLKRWKFAYHLDPAGCSLRTRRARRVIAEAGKPIDCLVQVGAWYDMTGLGMPVVSYHDGNLARRLDSPYGFPQISRRRIDRAFEYERQLYSRIDLIFPMSQWLAGSFIRDFGVPESKVIPVFAGINLPDRDQFQQASYESRHIVFVGKDFKRKGGADLLEAFSMLRREMPDARLTIVGPSEEIKAPGVTCVGPISKGTPDGLQRIQEIYQSAALFVLPTLYEPFGIAFAEAMAHGLPCIGTQICAVPEIIDDGRTGMLVAPGCPDQIAQRAFEILSDPLAARQMGEAAFDRYRQRFRWEAVAEQISLAVSNELL